MFSSDFSIDDFWAITAYFNPGEYEGRRNLFDIFRGHLRSQGVKLLVVELAFEKQPFVLSDASAEKVLQLRVDKRGVLWQKERLLNIALANLPIACGAFAWLDCDIIFGNSEWAAETVDKLTRNPIVQPFKTSIRLQPGQTYIPPELAVDKVYERRDGVVSFRYNTNLADCDYLKLGHTGFAWAARREVFDRIGIYDKMVIGGGDTVIASAFLGRKIHKLTHLLSEQLRRDQFEWIEKIDQRIKARTDYTPGVVFHLWHGEARRRQTQIRHRILSSADFDPASDLEIAENGCFRWTGQKPKLARAVRRYFWTRNEDARFSREFALAAVDSLNKTSRGISTALSNGFRRARSVFRRKMGDRVGSRKLSIVVINWKRPQLVSQLVRQYSRYECVQDIVIWDNNIADRPALSGDANVKYVGCRFDAGLDSRWAACLLTASDSVLVHDDDLHLSEAAMRDLFACFLSDPEIAHSVKGRSLTDGFWYNQRDVFGPVDIALTNAMIIDRKYVPRYFSIVSAFDDLRAYDCGNGEDIIMNYVISSMTRRKNFCHRLSGVQLLRDGSSASVAISKRPFHEDIRRAVVLRAINVLQQQKTPFFPFFDLPSEIAAAMPPKWTIYHRRPESISLQSDFHIEGGITSNQLARAVGVLSRNRLPESETCIWHPALDSCIT